MTEDERDILTLTDGDNRLMGRKLDALHRIIDRRIREAVEGRNRGEAHQRSVSTAEALELHRKTFGRLEK